MAAPTTSELELIPKFREAVKDLGLNDYDNSDSQLVRWLRARDLNLKKSEEMLRNSMKWRKEYDIDNILDWKAPDFLINEFPYDLAGYTEENSPILMFYFGIYDFKKVADMGKREDLLKYLVQIFVRILNECKYKINPKTKHPVTQFVTITDMHKYSYTQLTSMGAIKILTDYVQIFEANFPETLQVAYSLNAPKIFTKLFSMLKPFMAKNTIDKIQIFSKKVAKWKPVLQNNLPRDQFPLKYGGTAILSLLNQKGERGVLYKSVLNPDDDDGEIEFLELDFEPSTFEVKSGSKRKLGFDTAEPNTNISWVVKVEKNNIGFSILDENDQEMYPYKKSVEGDEAGSHIFEIPGTYYICLDNSYSKHRNKSVKIQVKAE